MRCHACQAEIVTTSRFCPDCGAGTGDAATLTLSMRQQRKPPSSSSASADEGRFLAGTLLAERYRILGLLGRGGMGEVYRASDLKLNQSVALKFLPTITAQNARLLERFHGEVRIARQVSHPNVCRVYDIGEVDGSAYISMEYVDGEDLGSLLRRIGRLPGDKAIEIARKLCAGLAAAHAKGVLHRDLKPANVMIDGRGQVLIMDFGLAALADQVEGAEVRNGTPAYMAPEQLAGREVSVRSDIYSLGLILFEVFTGQRAFQSTDRSALPSATSMVKEMDPVIERVIARCLDPDPGKRPQTALALARMLPGGDPLAEALAAGDTPSPEVVAASEDTGALSVRAAVIALAGVVAGLIALLVLSGWINILRLTPFPNSTDVLAAKAREITASLGYPDAPRDDYQRFVYENEYHDWAEKNLKPEDYRKQIELGQPSLIRFESRQSPQYLEPISSTHVPSADDPPMNVAGMVRTALDPQGRLLSFQAIPPQVDAPGPLAQTMDWNKLFAAAGLEASRWTPAEPLESPLAPFDERKAWTGSYVHAPNMPLRIEAAAWKGRAVSFAIFGPWRRPVRDQPKAEQTTGQRVGQTVAITVISLLMVGGLLLAWRNYRQGRGDSTGALRLAGVGFVFQASAQIVRMHHAPTADELTRLLNGLLSGLGSAGIVWIIYMALEPYLRRRWPQCLISWTRLVSGDWKDPLVGGHVLLGTALAVGVALLQTIGQLAVWRISSTLPLVGNTIAILSAADLAALILSGVIIPASIAMVFFFLLLMLRLVARKTWAASILFVALLTAVGAGNGGSLSLAIQFFYACAMLWVMLRFGLLPATMIILVSTIAGTLPLSSDLSVWYASTGLIAHVLVLVLAIWGFRNALGGRKVLKADLLDA